MFARELFEEIENCTEISDDPTTQEVKEGEEVIGALDEDLCRVGTVMFAYMRCVKQLAKEISHLEIDCADPHDCSNDKRATLEANKKKIVLALEQLEAVSKLFWASVKTAFPKHVKCSLVLRKGWKIVSLPQEDPSVIAILLGLCDMVPPGFHEMSS